MYLTTSYLVNSCQQCQFDFKIKTSLYFIQNSQIQLRFDYKYCLPLATTKCGCDVVICMSTKRYILTLYFMIYTSKLIYLAQQSLPQRHRAYTIVFLFKPKIILMIKIYYISCLQNGFLMEITTKNQYLELLKITTKTYQKTRAYMFLFVVNEKPNTIYVAMLLIF